MQVSLAVRHCWNDYHLDTDLLFDIIILRGPASRSRSSWISSSAGSLSRHKIFNLDKHLSKPPGSHRVLILLWWEFPWLHVILEGYCQVCWRWQVWLKSHCMHIDLTWNVKARIASETKGASANWSGFYGALLEFSEQQESFEGLTRSHNEQEAMMSARHMMGLYTCYLTFARTITSLCAQDRSIFRLSADVRHVPLIGY